MASVMTDSEEIKELQNKRLCFNCVEEDFLKQEIKVKGKKAECSYCGKVRRTFSIDEMSEVIEQAFDEHFVRTSDQPTSFQYSMLADKESDCDWFRDGEPVVDAIASAAEIPEDAASDIQQVLDHKHGDFDSAAMGEETEFAPDSYYEEKGTDDSSWQMEWCQVEESLKSQARFFNHPAAQHLASIFEGIESMCTWDGHPLIVDAGPNTSLTTLYRARVFQSDESLQLALQRPDRHIGTPPSSLANAGRMNAKGISIFYGANDPNVALAEVRPPVGSKVVVGCFEIVRQIRLLDLTALEKVATKGSIFDPIYSRRLEREMFLRSLSKRITKPVMPDDEAFDYLITQAISDYLANESKTNVDGIIFPSVQAAGIALNVVLFNKAAQVAEIDLPKGAEVEASLGTMGEDGWEDGYTIIVQTPPENEKPENTDQHAGLSVFDFESFGSFTDFDGFSSNETLKLDLESLKVHVIKAVQFTSDEHKVSHYRWEKHKSNF